MLYNKNQFKKVNDRKVLHKIKKHWVTLSIAMLGLIGGGAVTATHVSANANTSNQNNDDQTTNHQLATNKIQQPQAKLVNTNPTNSASENIHSNAYNDNNYANENTNLTSNNASANTKFISQQASQLHNQIVNHNVQTLMNSATGQQVPQQNGHNKNVVNQQRNNIKPRLLGDSQSKENLNGTWGTAKWNYNPNNGVLDIHDGTLTHINGNNGSDYIKNCSLEQALIDGGFRNHYYLSDIRTINLSDITLPSDSSLLFASAIKYDMNDMGKPLAKHVHDAINNVSNFYMHNVDSSHVTNMAAMFNAETHLRSLDLSGFDTSHVTNMSDMFGSDRYLKSVNLSSFNTSNVTNMWLMFAFDKRLQSLNLSNFNTSNVTNMEDMFIGDSDLSSLDLSNFNTSNVLCMANMFANDTNLRSIDLSSFNTSNVKYMNGMFDSDTNLPSVYLSNFDTSNVSDMSYMFRSDYNLQPINLGNFDTSRVTNMSSMFQSDKNVHSLDLSNFDTSNVSDMNNMFRGDSDLQSLDLSNFNTSNVTNMNSMFQSDKALQTLNLGNFDTSKVSNKFNSDAPYVSYNMENMFCSDMNLKKLTLGARTDLDKAHQTWGKKASWRSNEISGEAIPFFKHNVNADGNDSTKEILSGVQPAGTYYLASAYHKPNTPKNQNNSDDSSSIKLAIEQDEEQENEDVLTQFTDVNREIGIYIKTLLEGQSNSSNNDAALATSLKSLSANDASTGANFTSESANITSLFNELRKSHPKLLGATVAPNASMMNKYPHQLLGAEPNPITSDNSDSALTSNEHVLNSLTSEMDSLASNNPNMNSYASNVQKLDNHVKQLNTDYLATYNQELAASAQASSANSKAIDINNEIKSLADDPEGFDTVQSLEANFKTNTQTAKRYQSSYKNFTRSAISLRTQTNQVASQDTSTASSYASVAQSLSASTSASESTRAFLSASTKAKFASISTANSIAENSYASNAYASVLASGKHVISVSPSVHNVMVSGAAAMASYNQVIDNNEDATVNGLNELNISNSALVSEKANAINYVKNVYHQPQTEEDIINTSEGAQGIALWAKDPRFFTIYQAKPGSIANNVVSLYEPMARSAVSITDSAEAKVMSLVASEYPTSNTATSLSSHSSSSTTSSSTSMNVSNSTSASASASSIDIPSTISTITSYDVTAASYVNVVNTNLDRLNVSNNASLTSKKNEALTYASEDNRLITEDDEILGNLNAQYKVPGVSQTSSFMTSLNNVLSATSEVNADASLIVDDYVDPLDSQVAKDASNRVPSSSNNTVSSSTTNNDFDSSSADINSFNSEYVNPSASDTTNPITSTNSSMDSSSYVITQQSSSSVSSAATSNTTSNVPIVSLATNSNPNDAATNQNVESVNQTANWFYVDKTCLAHNHLSSVGNVKDYSAVLRPGTVAKIVKTFKVKYGNHSFIRYEIRVNGHNYFVTGNNKYTKNEYIQPKELKHDHKIMIQVPCFMYDSPLYSNNHRVKKMHRGQVLTIKRVINIGRKGHFMTRLELSNGMFITANRGFIKLI